MAGTAAVTLLGLLVAWWATPPSPPPSVLVPLTQYPGGESDPSFSPDGNFVAFAWSGPVSPSAHDIWVKAVDSEARRQITETPPPVGEQSPARSPDGKEFVFERVGWAEQFIPNAGVFVVSVLGGPERKISDSGRNPKWALDGRSVLIRDGSPVSIFQVDLQTLQRRPVTQAPSGSREWKFDISPDGSTLAFIRYERSGVGDVYVVSMAGGDPIRLTNWGSLINALAWTSDSRDIVYDVAGQSLWRIAAQTRSPAKGSALAGLESLRTPAANSHQAA